MENGELWGWGANFEGVLGPEAREGDHVIHGRGADYVIAPVHIMADVLATDMSGQHGAAIRYDNTLWTWGSNFNGELGIGTERGAWELVSARPHHGTLSAWLYPIQVMEYVSGSP
jgi:alpha-tubulin suppressor-like RCC1 family protein